MRWPCFVVRSGRQKLTIFSPAGTRGESLPQTEAIPFHKGGEANAGHAGGGSRWEQQDDDARAGQRAGGVSINQLRTLQTGRTIARGTVMAQWQSFSSAPLSQEVAMGTEGEMLHDRAKMQQDVVGMIESHRQRRLNGTCQPGVWDLVESHCHSLSASRRTIDRSSSSAGCGTGSCPSSAGGSDKEEICAICLDNLSEHPTCTTAPAAAGNETEIQPNGQVPLLIMPCSHWFHAACLLPWLMASNTCPVCRAAVEPACYHCRRKALTIRPWTWQNMTPPDTHTVDSVWPSAARRAAQRDAEVREERDAAGVVIALEAQSENAVEGQGSEVAEPLLQQIQPQMLTHDGARGVAAALREQRDPSRAQSAASGLETAAGARGHTERRNSGRANNRGRRPGGVAIVAGEGLGEHRGRRETRRRSTLSGVTADQEQKTNDGASARNESKRRRRLERDGGQLDRASPGGSDVDRRTRSRRDPA